MALACGLAACAQPPGLASLRVPTSRSASLTGSLSVEGAAASGAVEAIVLLEPIAPAAAPRSLEPVDVVVRGGGFEPRLLILQRGQSVAWTNLDSIFHGVFSYSPGNAFDLGVFGPRERRTTSLERAGPVRFHCPIHVGESAIAFVAKTPYFARSRGNRYVLAGIPPGRYWLSAWSDGWVAAAREVTLRTRESARADLGLRPERS